MKTILYLLRIGILNTIRLNLHYFGIKGLFCPIILASRNVRISTLKGNVYPGLKQIGAIRIGLGYVGTVDGKSSRCTWENTGDIYFEGQAFLNVGTCLINHGQLTIGDGATFNGNVKIICFNNIKIGNGFICAWDSQIMDTDFHKIEDFSHKRINEDRPIIIGNHVWIGTGCLILKGTVIPDNCVIAARSVVSKKMCYENVIYGSNSVIKEGIIAQ